MAEFTERDYIDSKIETINARLNGMDTATKVLSETVNRTPTEIQKEVRHLRELMDNQFTANNTAISKAEVATEKRFEEQDKLRQAQTDQLNRSLSKDEYAPAYKALLDKVDGLTTRFERMEGQGAGLRAGWGYLVAGVGLLIAVISFLATRGG